MGYISTHFMIQKNLNQLYFMQQEAGIKLYLSDKVTLWPLVLNMFL